MSAEAACVQANPSPVVPPIVVTGAHGALANVVVYVKSGLGSYRFDVPSAPVVLDQKGCMYVPRVLAVMANQSFEVHNEDQTIHNVHPMPRENRALEQIRAGRRSSDRGDFHQARAGDSHRVQHPSVDARVPVRLRAPLFRHHAENR